MPVIPPHVRYSASYAATRLIEDEAKSAFFEALRKQGAPLSREKPPFQAVSREIKDQKQTFRYNLYGACGVMSLIRRAEPLRTSARARRRMRSDAVFDPGQRVVKQGAAKRSGFSRTWRGFTPRTKKQVLLSSAHRCARLYRCAPPVHTSSRYLPKWRHCRHKWRHCEIKCKRPRCWYKRYRARGCWSLISRCSSRVHRVCTYEECIIRRVHTRCARGGGSAAAYGSASLYSSTSIDGSASIYVSTSIYGSTSIYVGSADGLTCFFVADPQSRSGTSSRSLSPSSPRHASSSPSHVP
eukprot:1679178-Rhodomonas_salina.1